MPMPDPLPKPNFNSTYGDNPWEGITDKTRMVYVPDLIDVFRRNSFFSQFVPYQVDLYQSRAMHMTFQTLYELEPITDPVGLRQIWFDTQRTDSENKVITMEHHSGKVTLLKFDDLINQWRRDGIAGLRQINRQLLAVSMTKHLDFLVMKALMEGTWKMYGADWDKSSFNDLDPDEDSYDPIMTDEVMLGMQTRGLHGAVDAVGTGEGQEIIALTTPGVIYSIQKNAREHANGDLGWIDRKKYADPKALLRYEVGSYRNTRYLSNPELILWNSGSIVTQAAVVEPVYPGAGAARNVDANRVVGQETLEAGTRYLQCAEDADLSDIEVNDIVTLHRVRTSGYGVTNGVAPFSGLNTHRRVVSVDNVAKRIAFERPVLKDCYTTDLGGSVYGYITKAVNVHPTVYLTGPNAVVCGVTMSPTPHTPPPIDDALSFFRFTWDGYLKYQTWNDHCAEVSFNTAPYRVKGLRRF